MDRIAKYILSTLFGAWNGIQIFFFPMLIFYWLDSESLVFWFSSLLSIKVHELPLTLFLLTLFYIGFLIFKFYSYAIVRTRSKETANDVIRFLLELHKGLLLILFVAIMMFVLSSFLRYFYSIEIPLKRIYASLFKYISLTLIMFYYIQSVWTAPFRKRGYSFNRSINHVIAFSRKTPMLTIRYSVLIVLTIICSVILYQILVVFVISPGLDVLSSFSVNGFRMKLLDASSSVEILYNVIMVVIAFVLSNLVFAPLVWLGSKLINYAHPINLKDNNAKAETQA